MNQIKAITIVENEPYLRKISSPIQFDDKDLLIISKLWKSIVSLMQ